MIKYIIVFLIGVVETIVYTAYLLSVNKKQAILSSIWLITQMFVYLTLVAWAIKGTETIPIILCYSLSTGIGNYLTIKWENRKHKILKSYDEE
jgi:uncharacterized protein YebE (UPF0316 family)